MGNECAGEQGAFWQFHDELWESGPYGRNGMYDAVERLGLDLPRFTACLEEERYAQIVDADIAFGKALEIQSVPTLLIQSGDQWTIQVGAAGMETLGPLLNQFLGQSGAP